MAAFRSFGFVLGVLLGPGVLCAPQPLFAQAAQGGSSHAQAPIGTAIEQRLAKGKATDVLEAARLCRGAYPASCDGQRVVTLYAKAVQLGSMSAAYELAELFRTGRVGISDLQQAETLLKIVSGARDPGLTLQAWFSLGELYRTGPLRDPAKALTAYEQAAAGGSGRALFALGEINRLGEGVPVDPVKAEIYYRKALAAGEGEAGLAAAFALAGLARDGAGPDPRKALALLTRAAEGHYAPALVALAEMYRTGDGVKADPQKAEDYLRQVPPDAPNGLGRKAAMALADLYRKGALRNPGKALDIYDKATARGEVWAVLGRADMYRRGDGVIPDPARAERDYQMLLATADPATRGRVLAALGDLYRRGRLRDIDKAMDFYRQAAEAGFPGGDYLLGEMLRLGDGIKPDPERARDLFEKVLAAPLGAGDAELRAQTEFALGLVYAKGRLRDPGRAIPHFERAAKARLPMALFALGEAYRTGAGVDRNPAKAKALLEEAAASNDPEAAKAAQASLKSL